MNTLSKMKQKRNNHKQMLAERNARLLKWIISEWDCATLTEAKEKAKEDQILHLRLREAGVYFSNE